MQSKYVVKFGQTGDLVSILQDALNIFVSYLFTITFSANPRSEIPVFDK